MAARPVVKWAGGKTRLVDTLLGWMPREMGTYVEPFCGGAAVFFALAAERKRRFKKAVLADKNEELVALYQSIKTDVETLIGKLRALRDEHVPRDEEGRREHFLRMRSADTSTMTAAERGARLVFLNKTCFNGLWRVNASGQFNVPFGRYANPKILDEKALRAAHEAFADVDIVCRDFAEVTRELGAGDFVYFDPPYVPVSKTANFTSYAADRFGSEEQARLADEVARLAKKSVKAMLSNASSPETKKLYARFPRVETVPVPRAINSDPKKRGEVDELVVMNWSERGARALRRRAAS